MLLTKEKVRTYPIITTLPPIANALRMTYDPPLVKVQIVNKDSQFLDSVTEIIRGLGGIEVDVIHSQMLYQYWSKPEKGKLNNQPRTLIITPQFLLLCNDDYTSTDVHLTLIDSMKIKDISKLRSEIDPTMITIIRKTSNNIFKSSIKWRLKCDTSSGVTKVKDECKKIMADIT
jgi:predicted N-acyltransferase